MIGKNDPFIDDIYIYILDDLPIKTYLDMVTFSY